MVDHLADVQKYDPKANPDIVAKIVKHLGIALRKKDSAMVAGSDPKELDRIKAGWITKKLGVTDMGAADEALKKTMDALKADRSKDRVTVYYMVAKHLGKLEAL